MKRTEFLLAVAVALPACDTDQSTDTGDDQADGDAQDGDDADTDTGDDDAGDDDDGSAADPCENIVPQGDAEGSVAADWTLVNTNGEDVSLHGFCGEVIFFEEGAYW